MIQEMTSTTLCRALVGVVWLLWACLLAGSGGGASNADHALVPFAHTNNPQGNSAGETCRQVLMRVVMRLPGCRPLTLVSFACSGTCHSRVVPEWRLAEGRLHYVTHCTCCKPRLRRYRLVELQCPGRRIKVIRRRFGAAIDCACRPCSDNST